MATSLGNDVFPAAYFRRGPAPGRIQAISARCTHLGCPTRYVQETAKFVCPCHGGVFNNDGVPVGGPPKRALEKIDVVVRDGQVYVVDPTYGKDSCK